jgi:hypothetical protein
MWLRLWIVGPFEDPFVLSSAAASVEEVRSNLLHRLVLLSVSALSGLSDGVTVVKSERMRSRSCARRMS